MGNLTSSGDSLKILTGDDEYAVIRSLADFKDAIVKAAKSNEPFMISRQIATIARAHNRFYNKGWHNNYNNSWRWFNYRRHSYSLGRC